MKKLITIVKEEQAKRKDGTLVEGTSPKGNKWALWVIYDQQNNKYSVFGSILDEAGVKAGDQVDITYTTEKQGKFTNNKVTSVSKAGTEEKPQKTQNLTNNKVSNDKFSELMAAVNEIQGTVMVIDSKLDSLLKENEPNNK